MTIVGVLALQGAFAEHCTLLQRLGVQTREVRLPADLEGLAGLIIPGGESTTIGKLATTYGLIEPLRFFAQRQAVWGTCAGAIFLGRDAHRDQPLLAVMDISVQRNAFGRQVDSFQIQLDVPVLGEAQIPFPAFFIRAPVIESVGEGVEVLARLPAESGSGEIVAAQQGRLLATSFHPELTSDTRFHEYFIGLAQKG